MPSGGARARSGPAPDPGALRRDRKDDASWLILPVDGRPGNAPAWPLTKATTRETALWRELWKTPQAWAWERTHVSRHVVALYVRKFVEAEERYAQASKATIVRQLADDLGLTHAGLSRNRWRVGGVAPVPSAPTTPAARRKSSRTRLTVVKPPTNAG